MVLCLISPCIGPRARHLLLSRFNCSLAWTIISLNVKYLYFQESSGETLKYDDGSTYIGEVRNGKPNGKGFITGRPGSKWAGRSYDGDWVDGKIHGFGVYKNLSGDIYAGQWKFDKAHGKGFMKWASGSSYDGDWVDNKRHGFGVSKDGAIYAGQWKFGKRHGKGFYKWSPGSKRAGDSYDGDWKDDKRTGFGVYRYSSGASYDGYFVNGKKHGLRIKN